MGGAGFDRNAFTHRQEKQKRSPSPIAGLLLLVLVVGLLAFGGYSIIRATGIPQFGASAVDPNLATVVERLEAIEERLENLEKRRARSASPPPSAPATNRSTSGASSSSSPTSTRRAASRPAPPRSLSKEEQQRIADLQQKYGTLRSDIAANQEAWDATTDSVARTSVRVGEQGGEIEATRQRLQEVEKRFNRTPVAFQVRKGSSKERVGPVWLWLRKTDKKRHRYTMRVFVDDRWIELKDRAMLEPVEFYVSGMKIPVVLLVTEIQGDRVKGTLYVPPGLYAR